MKHQKQDTINYKKSELENLRGQKVYDIWDGMNNNLDDISEIAMDEISVEKIIQRNKQQDTYYITGN